MTSKPTLNFLAVGQTVGLKRKYDVLQSISNLYLTNNTNERLFFNKSELISTDACHVRKKRRLKAYDTQYSSSNNLKPQTPSF